MRQHALLNRPFGSAISVRMMIRTLLAASVLALGNSPTAQAVETAPGMARPRLAAAVVPAWCRQKSYVRRWQGGVLSPLQAARCVPAPAPAADH